MTTTDHPPGSASSLPDPEGSRVLHHALGAISVLDRTSVATAAGALVAVADRTGHAPLCVARQLLHLLDPAHHPRGHRTIAEAVHRRWAWPLHQRRHPTETATDRMWTLVLDAAAATRPPVSAGLRRTAPPAPQTPRTPKAPR